MLRRRGSGWPAFEASSPARLERVLDGFFAARTIAECQAPIEGLLDLAKLRIGPMEQPDRSLWKWFLAWADAPAATAVQFALFADEYHDAFAAQANPMAVAVLGTATPEELGGILRAGLRASAALDLDAPVLSAHPVPVHALRQAWSQRLGVPVEHAIANGAPPAGEARSLLDETLAAAEAGDEAQQALIAAMVARGDGRHEDALACLEHGARLGNVDAMLGAAAVARDLRRTGLASYWIEQAAAAGSPEAMFDAGLDALAAGRLDDASRWLEASGARGNAEAYAALIEVADRARDQRAQAHWAATGAQLRHPRCLEVHALNVLRGNEQDPRAFQEALSLMEAAARQGYAAAMDRCGVFHFHSGNPTQARYWWLQAEQAGDPDARGRLEQHGLA